MKRLLLTTLLSLTLASLNSAWAWDDDWTHAKSGKGQDIFDDPGRSQGQAGTDPPQKFWIPGPRDYVEVDPEELNDYFDRKNRHYAPYVFVRIEQTLHYQNLTIPKGYYLIKPGDKTDGSPKVTLETLTDYGPQLNEATQESGTQSLPPLETEVETETEQSTQTPLPPTSPPQGITTRPPNLDSRVPVYQTFLIIKQGRVVGVVPVHRMQPYKPPKGQKTPRHALAWVEWVERRPVLKFYYKKWVYETEFQ